MVSASGLVLARKIYETGECCARHPKKEEKDHWKKRNVAVWKKGGPRESEKEREREGAHLKAHGQKRPVLWPEESGGTKRYKERREERSGVASAFIECKLKPGPFRLMWRLVGTY